MDDDLTNYCVYDHELLFHKRLPPWLNSCAPGNTLLWIEDPFFFLFFFFSPLLISFLFSFYYFIVIYYYFFIYHYLFYLIVFHLTFNYIQQGYTLHLNSSNKNQPLLLIYLFDNSQNKNSLLLRYTPFNSLILIWSLSSSDITTNQKKKKKKNLP